MKRAAAVVPAGALLVVGFAVSAGAEAEAIIDDLAKVRGPEAK